MGIVRSKIKAGAREKGNKNSAKPSSTPDDRKDEYEDVELILMRRAIKKDPDSFILNNLMMCVQFFENYEEDIIQVKESLASSYEAKLNKVLPPQKHVLMPDVLQEHIAHNVVFTSTRQTFRPTIEPLQPVRIYVVHDNIEITEHHYQPEYSSMNDATTYNMLVKPSEHQVLSIGWQDAILRCRTLHRTREVFESIHEVCGNRVIGLGYPKFAHGGYVRLELLDETPFPIKKVDNDPSAEDDDSTVYSDGDSIYGPKPSSKMVLPQRTKRRNLRTSKVCNAMSLPNIYDDEIIYEDQAYHSRDNIYRIRSNRDVKGDSDYEHIYSASEGRRSSDKKTWSKSELQSRTENKRRFPQSTGATKLKKTKDRSSADSTSSGYRSGNYADSDSDSSCHTIRSSSTSCKMNHSDSSCHTIRSPRASCKTNRDSSCDNSQNYIDKTVVADASTDIYSMSNARIPRRCFKRVMHTREGKIYDPREERRYLQNSKQRRLRMAMRRRNYEVSYTSSLEFMRHFINLFKNQLGQPLGFDQEDLDEAKPEGSVINCDRVMVSHNSRFCRVDSYEITPTVWLQWPECAQEWLDRPRSTWPSYDDISKVKDFGCYVVPEGYLANKNCNIYQELEWQLMFPAAERYLETCMTHSQVQVYLIALMLHKTFVRPVFDTLYGLTASHIRNKMFWLIEEDDRPSKWPENRTGECLIKLLNSIKRCLSQNEPFMLDYFVRDKNVFQRVPSDHLLHTQKQLKRIIENPVMYLFHAMENIRHSEKFFPRLDYELLLKILTMDTLALLNPALGQHMFISSSRTSTSESRMSRDEIYNRPGGFWDSAKMQTEQKVYSTRVVTNKTLINPRKATDSIIEITVRCAELEGPRLGALLDFFIRHFIKMAERCHQYRADQQKKVYLDQADRLSIILSELVRYKDDAMAYRDKIHALRTRVTSSRSQKEPPKTPKRNFEAPLFVGSLKDRFTREATEISIESKDERPQSSPEEQRGDRKVTKALVHEMRFKREENAQARTRKTKTSDEKIPISGKPISRDQNNGSIPGTSGSHRVVSLAGRNESFLSETTYI